MFGYLEHAFAWHIATAQHILKKWKHIELALWSAKRNNDYGIVVR